MRNWISKWHEMCSRSVKSGGLASPLQLDPCNQTTKTSNHPSTFSDPGYVQWRLGMGQHPLRICAAQPDRGLLRQFSLFEACKRCKGQHMVGTSASWNRGRLPKEPGEASALLAQRGGGGQLRNRVRRGVAGGGRECHSEGKKSLRTLRAKGNLRSIGRVYRCIFTSRKKSHVDLRSRCG